jgi:uncharacterized membrane protein YdjX (TVP38/TMEM64 family)
MTDTLLAPRGGALAVPAPGTDGFILGNDGPALGDAGPALGTEGAAGTRGGWHRRLVRFGVLGAAVTALGVAATTLPLHAVASSIAAFGTAGAVTIAVIGGLLLSVLVPRTAITLACGALLGPATGAATALGAAVIAAVATYLLGRWAGRGVLTARAGSRLERLDGWLNRRGLSAVLLVRFLPLAPYGLIGYAYGTTSVCRKQYLLGTTLASIPSAVTYAVIGAAVAAPGQMSPLTLAPALIGFTLTTTIVVRWRRSARRDAAAALATA